MAKRKPKLKSKEELVTENELLKLKMMAEQGGKFYEVDDIPPAVENKFLKQLVNFHKKHKQPKLVSVYEYIGRPHYTPLAEVNDKNATKELKQLIALMNRKGIHFSYLPYTSPLKAYRFIIEILFTIEIGNIKLKDWVTEFSYEDFWPADEWAVRETVHECMQMLFNKGTPFVPEHFNDNLKDHLGLSIDAEEQFEKINHFWNKYHHVKLEIYDIETLSINEQQNTAHAICLVTYKTQSEKRARYKTETATVEINLVRIPHLENWWETQQIICDLIQ